MKTVILKGYYGRDNFGDEIMMDLIIKFFKEKYPTMQLQVMNSNPKMLEEKYSIYTPKELVTGNYGKKGIIKRILSILKADCYIVGGGTIITDKHSSMHLVEYLIEFAIRKLLKRPSLFISVGATEFKHKRTKLICRLLLSFCDACLVRDTESFELLSNIYKGKTLILTGDLVLLAFTEEEGTLVRDNTHDGNNIGFSLMPYYESLYKKGELDVELAEQFASVIDVLIDKGFHVSLIPIQSGNNNDLDYRFSKQVAEICKKDVEVIECRDNKEKMVKILQQDYLVSMRLHALLYAIANNLKFIAINHNEKIESCLKVYGAQEQSVGFDNLCDIVPLVLRLKKKSDYQQIVSEQYDAAKKNFEYLASVLNKVSMNE